MPVTDTHKSPRNGGNVLRQMRVQPLAQCTNVMSKIENIDAQMKAMETMHRELMAIQDRLEFASSLYTVVRLTKDTMLGVLDLAASMLPGAAGKTATYGRVAVDTASSLSEIAHGQGNAGEIASRTANSALAIAGRQNPSAGQGYALDKLGDINALVDGVRAAKAAPDASSRQKEAERTAVNMAADKIKSVAGSMSQAEGDMPGMVGQMVGAHQAAYNYRAALDATFDERIRDMQSIWEARYLYTAQHKRIMAELQAKMRGQMDELKSCVR